MRIALCSLLLVCWLFPCSSHAATARVIKVLPQFLDLKGRTTVSPSLYDRDAYQAQLRLRPEEQSGMRFMVQWKGKGPVRETLKLRVEIRGYGSDSTPKEKSLETPVTLPGWLGRWTELSLTGEAYKNFGTVTAWRATLWDGNELLGEQKSFLW